MQIKMRKVLALLSVLAMLCTLLPLGAVVFAEDASDFVVNGDFETGDLTGWKSGYNGEIQSDIVHGGSYAHKTTNTASKYQGMMQQNPISVVPNSDYTVTFWYYYEGDNATGTGASFYLYAQTTDNSTNIKSLTSYPTEAGVWYQATHTFNTGDNDAIALVWSNRMASDGGTYYFDDIVMTGPSLDSYVPEVPEDFGRVDNGGFEEETGGWTIKYGERTNADSYSGDYSLLGTSLTKYGAYAYTTIDVVPNSDYTISFKLKVATAGSANIFRMYTRETSDTSSGSTSYPQWNISDATTEWKSYSQTVNSQELSTMYITFAQGATTDTGSTYYIDDIIVEGPDPADVAPEGNETPSNDGYITNGDFETGDLTGWTVADGGEIIWDDNVANGNFSLMGTATAKYSAFVKQTVACEANTDYVLTFKAKLAASGGQPRFYIKDGAEAVTLNSSNYYFTGSTEWTTYQIAFNSGEYTSLVIYPAQGVANGGNVYYDDIVMTKATTGYTGLYPEEMTSGADIRFMTYNVLVGQDTENGGYSWGSAIDGRPEKAFAMINYYKPDVIAFEEFSGEWYDAFTAQMTNYAFGEMTSADSQNNGKLYTCLAYNTETVRLLSTDLFRNTVSRWGTQGMRYVNVGFFEVIATGEKFIAAATHPDAGDLVGTDDLNGDGVAEEGAGYWRPQQLEEAAAYVAELSETNKLPVVWGGDFNSGLDGTYDDNVSWYKVADAGFTDATAGRYIDHIFYNGMATHLYETTVADAAVNGASDHNAVFADIQFLDEYATPIKTAKDYIKTQGRTYLKDGAMWLDFSASGVEFSANCEGTVALNLTVNSIKNTDATYGGIYFTVIVDGVQKDRAECRITETGSVQLVLAEDLPAGNHTFEVYRQTEHRGAEVGISSIVMNGEFNDKPEDIRLYIEFIGDSISTGYGALGVSGNDQADSPLWQDATAAYPYLTAKALGADFSDVAWSGLGCKYGYQSLTMQTVYTAQRYNYDSTTQYDFTKRQPDVVVIALGTNDIANQEDASLREAGYQEMLDLVRAKNPNSKIVWIGGMMKTDDNEMLEALIETNGGAAEGLYFLGLTTNTAGAGWHPSAAGQQVFADELVAYLNSDVLVKYVADEETDKYDVMDSIGTSRMEMTADKLGLAFGFKIHATGVAVKEGTATQADLTNATIDAFDDGGSYKLLAMGAIVTNDITYGLADMTKDDVDGKKVLDVNAKYLNDLEADSAQFAVRITNIPLANEDTIIYARAYYVFEYEGREIIVYDDLQQANYINKYDSNDGVLEW